MISTEDLKAIEVVVRRVVREELAAARHADNVFNDQAYLVATTTPQERNQMARVEMQAQRAAQKAAAKLAGKDK